MPELPEVQTVLDTLHAQMGHARICDVQVRWARIIHGDPQTFASLVCGRRIEDYARIGKYLCFDLGDVWWIAHLRMEGKFYLQQPSAPVDARHVHVIFQLEDGRELRYHDTRKFGRMYAYPKQGSLRECPCFARVGKDALDETLMSCMRICMRAASRSSRRCSISASLPASATSMRMRSALPQACIR